MGAFTPRTRHTNVCATHMPCTYQAFSLFATGIVSPRVSLFRKYNPTCTADDDADINVGLVITLAILAAVALLLVSVVVHLIRMVRRVPAPLPPPLPCPCSHLSLPARALAAPARDETQPR